MLSALSVVLEKELGSFINLYVTPTTRSEFFLGKQLPYIALGMLNFFLLCGLSVFVFGVPHKGSFLTLTLAALLYIIIVPHQLMMITTMISAHSVVREIDLGSIINLYVTPTTRREFLLGKQLPYIALVMLNFFLLCCLSVFVFGVPHKGSFLTLTLAALLSIIIATGRGLLISTFMKIQISAIFGTQDVGSARFTRPVIF